MEHLTANFSQKNFYLKMFEWFLNKPFNSQKISYAVSDFDLSHFKGTVMQIEKAQTNDSLRASKLSWKFRFLSLYNFAVIYT